MNTVNIKRIAAGIVGLALLVVTFISFSYANTVNPSGTGGGGGGTAAPTAAPMTYEGYVACHANTTCTLSSSATLTGGAAGTIAPGDILAYFSIGGAAGTGATWPGDFQSLTLGGGLVGVGPQFSSGAGWCAAGIRIADSNLPATWTVGGSLSSNTLVDFRPASTSPAPVLRSLITYNVPGAGAVNQVFPQVVTTGSNPTILAFACNVGNTSITTPPTGYTTILSQPLIGGTSYPIWVGYQQVSGGPTVVPSGTIVPTPQATSSAIMGAFAIGQ